MSEITPNSYGLFDTPVRSPEKERVALTQADIERQLDAGAFLMSREEAVAVLRELLAGRGPEAMRNMLALNVGMGMYLLEEKMPLATCMARAREALASGAGRKVLNAA